MGLLPLEYTDCLTDTPHYRENLRAHEKELERTSQAIKGLIKEVKDLLAAAKRIIGVKLISEMQIDKENKIEGLKT
ncbi:UNVERIFIED_CONTAM: Rho GTPase-activating protein 10 [Trichonephila clavipes]